MKILRIDQYFEHNHLCKNPIIATRKTTPESDGITIAGIFVTNDDTNVFCGRRLTFCDHYNNGVCNIADASCPILDIYSMAELASMRALRPKLIS